MLRALEAGVDPGPAVPTAPWRRRLAVGSVLAALATLAGLLLASGTAVRGPGQTVTGNAQNAVDPRVALEQAVQQRPEDPLARLGYARFLLVEGEPVEAIRQFDETVRLDPDNAEARAYGGWIVFLAGIPDEARRRLDRAVEVDPAYPDAHFFRGMVLRSQGDPLGAATELRSYLDLSPEGPMSDQVETVLKEMEEASSSSGDRP